MDGEHACPPHPPWRQAVGPAGPVRREFQFNTTAGAKPAVSSPRRPLTSLRLDPTLERDWEKGCYSRVPFAHNPDGPHRRPADDAAGYLCMQMAIAGRPLPGFAFAERAASSGRGGT